MAKLNKGYSSKSPNRTLFLLLILVIATIGVAYYAMSNQIGLNPFAAAPSKISEPIFAGAQLTSDASQQQVKQVARDYRFTVNVSCSDGGKIKQAGGFMPRMYSTVENEQAFYNLQREYINPGVWRLTYSSSNNKLLNEDRVLQFGFKNMHRNLGYKLRGSLPKGMFNPQLIGINQPDNPMWVVRDLPSGEYTLNYQLNADSFPCTSTMAQEFTLEGAVMCANNKKLGYERHSVALWGLVWPPNPANPQKSEFVEAGSSPAKLTLKNTDFMNYNYLGMITDSGQYLQPLGIEYASEDAFPTSSNRLVEIGKYFRNNIPLLKWHGAANMPTEGKYPRERIAWFLAPDTWCR